MRKRAFVFHIFPAVGMALLLIALMPSVLHAQSYRYDVVLLGQTVGEVNAVCRNNNGQVDYTIKSKVQLRLIPGGNISTAIEASYANNILQHAVASRETGRDNKNKSTTTRKNTSGYEVILNGTRSQLREPSIRYSVACLFFTEPQNISRLFSETLGTFLPLASLGNHQYKLQMPDGNDNIYSYANGKLISVEVNQTLGKVYFKLKN